MKRSRYLALIFLFITLSTGCKKEQILVEIPVISVDSVESRQARTPERMQLVEHIRSQNINDEAVLRAFTLVPREDYVTVSARHRSYEDRSLPSGHGQSTLKPSLLAAILAGLKLKTQDRVLEIGTGSGYMTALLGHIVDEVYSIEIVEALGEEAKETLRRAGFENVKVKIGDGYEGWEEYAPFDVIVVSCSPDEIPTPLKVQLKEGGRVAIPVSEGGKSTLYFMHKEGGELVEDARQTVNIPKMQKVEKIQDTQEGIN